MEDAEPDQQLPPRDEAPHAVAAGRASLAGSGVQPALEPGVESESQVQNKQEPGTTDSATAVETRPRLSASAAFKAAAIVCQWFWLVQEWFAMVFAIL